MSIFTRRVAYKPFEYPDVLDFQKAIQHSYWLVSEWNFLSDIHDFHTRLNPRERSSVKNALLAISQIEVSVKRFWARLGDRLPKAEFEQVGAVFAESEVRHADAYSHLLGILGLDADFELLLQNPVIQGRVDYLTKYLKNAADNGDEGFALTLALFAVFIENVSLFSQFLVVKSFNKYRGVLKDIDNVVQATQQEETLHALLGVRILEIIRRENPDWFNETFYAKLRRACHKAYAAECNIIDWIFEAGDLDFLTKDQVREFTRKRFNDSLALLGIEPLFETNQDLLTPLSWFDEELAAEVSTDFFHKKPITYSKKVRSITAEDLF